MIHHIPTLIDWYERKQEVADMICKLALRFKITIGTLPQDSLLLGEVCILLDEIKAIDLKYPMKGSAILKEEKEQP